MSDFNPSTCDVTEAIVRSHDGSSSQDISDMVVAFEIAQSMDSVSYDGTLTVLDTIGFLEDFPLRSEETIELKIISYDLQTEVSLKTHIYKISDIIPSESNNGILYVIHFVSKITFDASLRKVVKSYRGSPSTSAKELFNTYFSRIGQADYLDQNNRGRVLPLATGRYNITAETERNIYIQPAGNLSKIIIPYLTPSEAMVFLAARSFAGDVSPSQTFRFFETLENYYFATDEYFIKDVSDADVINLFYSPASSLDPTRPQDQLNRIENLQIISKGIDAANDVYSGAYRTTVTELDLIRRRVDYLKFDYSRDAKYIDMSGSPRRLRDNPHTEQFRNDAFTEENARQFMVFRDYTRSGDIPTSLHTDKFVSQIIANRVSYYHHLNNTTVSASLKGRLDLRPGNIVNLNIKALSANAGQQINDTMSGRYLVKSTMHSRDMDGILNTSLVLIKFDWSKGPENV